MSPLEPALAFDVSHQAVPIDADVASGTGYGARARLRWADPWAAEVAASWREGAFDPRLGLVRFFGDDAPYLRPFAAGAAGAWIEPGGAIPLAEAGFGLDIETFRTVDLRADARWRLVGLESGFVLGVGLQIRPPRRHDADHDGIVDLADLCLSEAEDADGWVDEDGCPDPDDDRDGVADATDWCRRVAEDVDGFGDADGCPDPDNDGDGIVDGLDMCVGYAEDDDGFADADGCPDPDDDTDGIADLGDACRFEPETGNGFQDEDGCPDEIPPDLARITGRIDGIGFFAGTDDLLPAAELVLVRVVGLLEAYPDVRIVVLGHTDDQGDYWANLALSQARADAVAAWLAAHGVDRDRLAAAGFGETRPVVPNTTEANRGRNRRVEIRLIGPPP